MSPLTIAWSMCAAVCFMLGLMHILLWLQHRQNRVYLLSSLMTFAAGASALLELGMLSTQSIETYRVLIRWENLAIFMILVPMVWFVQSYFHKARRWLAISITLMWCMGILINFLSPNSLTFSTIDRLEHIPTFWGELITLPSGTANPWKPLADLASILILAYVADATLRSWRRAKQKQALTIGSSILIFIVAAGIHTPLVDAGLVRTPYMISFVFMGIVATLSYQLAGEAIRAQQYGRELQRTRRQLDQLTRLNLLGECTTIIAHELAQPLAAILSNAQAARKFLAENGSGHREAVEILDDIVRDDKRASEIIQRIRSMLQNEEVVRERFDLNAAIGETVNMLADEFRTNNVRLVEDYAATASQVHAGRIEIQQVILNLLINAIRAMNELSHPDRVLSIRTLNLDRNVQVEVEDTGNGLPADAHKTLFNTMFYESKDGLGLGLTICRRIIETYGGRIQARYAESGGAVFSFSLPVRG